MPGAAATLETVDLLYRAAIEPELWPEALEKLAHAVGCTGTVMIPITPNNAAGVVVSPTLVEPAAEYDREWWRYDTRVARIFARRLASGVFCEAELFSDEELARDPMRQEFLAPHGLGAFAAQLVEPWPGHVVSLSVQRTLRNGHFERRELDALNWLGGHAARALIISHRLAKSDSLARGLLEIIGRFDGGVFVLDRRREVAFMNAAAERILGDGLTVARRRLLSPFPDKQRALDLLIDSAFRYDDDANSKPVALARPSGKKPFLVQVVPFRSSRLLDQPETRALGFGGALLLVIDPDRPSVGPHDALRLLGLTVAEARLAALIGGGMRRRDAADQLGISEATVHDTMKNIYSKLDINSQGELVRLVDRLAIVEPRKSVRP